MYQTPAQGSEDIGTGPRWPRPNIHQQRDAFQASSKEAQYPVQVNPAKNLTRQDQGMRALATDIAVDEKAWVARMAALTSTALCVAVTVVEYAFDDGGASGIARGGRRGRDRRKRGVEKKDEGGEQKQQQKEGEGSARAEEEVSRGGSGGRTIRMERVLGTGWILIARELGTREVRIDGGKRGGHWQVPLRAYYPGYEWGTAVLGVNGGGASFGPFVRWRLREHAEENVGQFDSRGRNE
ncbi:hypothetical protein B0H13DRAFT_1889553 [Mycena leptocephala]|nr:hypothetical protein B0H13DRAFT_1889553 [Mycena leptocephala]